MLCEEQSEWQECHGTTSWVPGLFTRNCHWCLDESTNKVQHRAESVMPASIWLQTQIAVVSSCAKCCRHLSIARNWLQRSVMTFCGSSQIWCHMLSYQRRLSSQHLIRSMMATALMSSWKSSSTAVNLLICGRQCSWCCFCLTDKPASNADPLWITRWKLTTFARIHSSHSGWCTTILCLLEESSVLTSPKTWWHLVRLHGHVIRPTLMTRNVQGIRFVEEEACQWVRRMQGNLRLTLPNWIGAQMSLPPKQSRSATSALLLRATLSVGLPRRRGNNYLK